MITSNVLQRVYQIKYNDTLGTCFSIDVDSKQYFVTAKHVIEKLPGSDFIELLYNNNWTRVAVQLVGHSEISDVSVFVISFLTNSNSLPTNTSLVLGQDVYFLGFPYGLKIESGNLNNNFPFPLVKKGIISAFFINDPGKYFFIDGHNNPGFSGGPVVFSNNNPINFFVIGIISGFRFDLEKTIFDEQEIDVFVKVNTGIIIAYSIENALNLIHANPIGQPIK